MSEYVGELRELFEFCRAVEMPFPDRASADESWLSAAWGDVLVSRSHGETAYLVEFGANRRTEHTSLVHALRYVAGLLDKQAGIS